MDNLPATTASQSPIADACARLPFEEARRLRALCAAVELFDGARDKAAAWAEVAGPLEAAGVRGVSLQSLYRKAALYRAGGPLSLVDGRSARKRAGTGVSANRELLGHWHSLVAANRRKSAPALRALVEELRAGKTVPGIGTWRDAWAADHGGVRPPEGMPCPYRVGAELPRGWSRLLSLKPDAYAIIAARKGTMAAALEAAPAVVRTRAGLQPMQCVQIDDMWHEVKVVYAKGKAAERVVEYSAVDVLTGHVVAWIAKPVRARDDGTRETLRGLWTRYVVAHLLCDVGITEAGCLIMGEHGTATLDATTAEMLYRETAGRVRFGAGGLLSRPLAKGLPGGVAKGNPRYKGIVEGLHALLKNELGATRGHIGGGRGAEPEDAAALDRADRDLRRLAEALEAERPGILARIRSSYLTMDDYMRVVGEAYRRIDLRTEHDMEAWEACGFTTGEWRPAEGSPWLPMASLDAMDPRAAEAFRSVIMADPALFRARRLSPREAWDSRKAALRPLGPAVAVAVMGRELARPCVCDRRLTLHYRDAETERSCQVAGRLDSGALLTRGETYNVWVNPLAPDSAYVADAEGRYLGRAPVMEAAMYGDEEALHEQLGIRSAAIAAERERMAPIIRERLRQANEDARQNAVAILGRDPAEAADAPKAPRPSPAARRDALEVLAASTVPAAPAPSFADDGDDADGVADFLAGITQSLP